MTTDALTSDFAQTSLRLDQRRGVDLWLRTWIALAIVVALTVIAYLILISSSLASINSHLRTARDAVVDVNGNTKTLPDQISAVNDNLASIDDALKPIPAQAASIRDNLRSVEGHGATINSALTSTSSQLAGAAHDLAGTAPQLSDVTSKLANTSRLLQSILSSAGTISGSLRILQGTGAAGVGRTNARVTAILGALRPTRADLGDILSGLRGVDGHLTNVCKSVAINLLHGRQPC